MKYNTDLLYIPLIDFLSKMKQHKNEDKKELKGFILDSNLQKGELAITLEFLNQLDNYYNPPKKTP